MRKLLIIYKCESYLILTGPWILKKNVYTLWCVRYVLGKKYVYIFDQLIKILSY